jgi:uracil-DNA glycosylase
MKVKLEPSWHEQLKDEFEKPYFEKLATFVKEEYSTQTVYPKGAEIFNAFTTTPFDKVEVVVLGQDPYHGEGQAHGLCFSVKKGVKSPPSLQNIFKEINTELSIKEHEDGDLNLWAEQGVLLLNSVLTVRASTPGSHAGKGWEVFTDSVIQKLNENKRELVFMLWGSYAIQKGQLIDRKKHLVLEAPHPSPFSVHRGFFGCGHFKKCNEYLKEHHKKVIQW